MVQDDDVRVTAGNAHQTARTIVEESKATIILLKCIKGEPLLNDVALCPLWITLNGLLRIDL